MASNDLTATCVTLSDFTSLLEISFALNLALSVFREAVVFTRQPLQRSVEATEGLIRTRTFATTAQQSAALGRLSSIKRNLIATDDALKLEVNCCAIVTAAFALHSLYWLAAAPFFTECLDGLTGFLAIGLNFLPCPIAIALLSYRSRRRTAVAADELRALQSEMMGA